MGHSSGAHLAMLYAYKPREIGAIPIAFCVTMAGPTDLRDVAFRYNFEKLRWTKLFYQIAEKATGYQIQDGDMTDEGYSQQGLEILAAISPVTFAGSDSPPTIIVHDASDSLVPYANSAVLDALLTMYGVDHRFIALYSGIGHFLGAKVTKGGALRYDATMATRLTAVMIEYIEEYCR
jgi:acetyl esterase/lipase